MTLRECPFCGSTDVHVTLYNHPSVVCHACWAIGPKGPRLSRSGGETIQDTVTNCASVQEAVRAARELWNKRATDPIPGYEGLCHLSPRELEKMWLEKEKESKLE